MALVGYSDSEESDVEQQTDAVSAPDRSKKFDRTSTKKIKVDLAGLTANNVDYASEEPANKRQRTVGAFSGFNALLPAPKRTAKTPVKRNITLRTSSEAAFSREPQQPHEEPSVELRNTDHDDATVNPDTELDVVKAPEVKLVGKATRFVPLSVANARKRKPPVSGEPSARESSQSKRNAGVQPKTIVEHSTTQPTSGTNEAKPKPKRSLFSSEPGDSTGRTASSQSYQPEFSKSNTHLDPPPQNDSQSSTLPVVDAIGTGLQHVAADLNLSANERRRLFGRNAGREDIKIAHFNMDAEYRANQELAAKGDLVEHRAVKAIAPGKHSLQQLVNNVKGQTDALEDKWAEGRRNRSETGNKYGW